ncbi:MAG: hypothetical protein JWM19_1153 [Actinomycetia bacterium]|nr:hypothetical protein [Actinomycetes bacterium]
MSTSDLIGFILARLDEDERTAALFHELTCPAPPCHCPVPRQILRWCQAERDIVTAYERQLTTPGTQAAHPPISPATIRQSLGAMALPHETHPQWREHWRP